MLGDTGYDNAHYPDMTGVRAAVLAVGLVDPSATWTALSGGRTNWIWRVGDDANAIVCKVFRAERASYLFPNDFEAESAALQSLKRSGIAPDYVAELELAAGPCLLYRHVQGDTWQSGAARVAQVVARLHARPAPALRNVGGGSDALRAQGLAVLADVAPSRTAALIQLCPQDIDVPASESVFVHGDLVPANVICHNDTTTLIDWQCPALGDPCEDLATFLSPAMQTLYGRGQLAQNEEAEFLSSYANRAVTDRLKKLRPLFHWRMAAHCLWKVEQGDHEYRAGMDLEIAALKRP